jgi:hypothetical protein
MRTYLSILLLTVLGCSAVPMKIVDPYPTMGMPIAQARIDNAKGDKPAVAKDLDNIEVAAKQVSAEYVDVQQMRAEDDAFILKHNGDWLGARTHRLAKLIIFIGAPLVAILGAFLTYSGGLGVFAHVMLGVCSGGIHAIHLAVLWIVNKIKSIRAAKAQAVVIAKGA